MGKLRGVKLTPALRSVVDAALALSQPPAVASGEASRPRKSEEAKSDDDGASAPSAGKSSSPRAMAASSPSEILAEVQEATRVRKRPNMTVEGAKSTLETAAKAGVANSDDGAPFLPLAGAEAIKVLIDHSQSSPNEKSSLLRRLDAALRQTTLSFAPNPPPKASNPQFQKRLERLRLQDEERSYKTLTTNLKTAASLKDDNVTAKSMMYATSVGLNMVVAPISFGVFMYFFAGSIFSRFFDEEERGNDIDIRRVIAGVVSGVFMLFVEMILFVIRSHELDASVRKKSRRRENRANPFGYTQKSMERVYVRDD
ncbi:hypothetical protein ACHAXT_012676 [Thalassiosira profunda]